MRSAAIRTLEGLLGLPPSSNGARCVRDLPVPMRDGVVLLADRWHSDTEGGGDDRAVPTLLVRSPYERRSMYGFLYGRLFAERGFQVIVQSCRGTFGSGGSFRPMIDDATDGEDTVAWLRDQPWFGGEFATVGASYLCYAQWALAASCPPELRAMVAQVGPDRFGPAIYPGGVFALDTALGFAAHVSGPPVSPIRAMLSHVWDGRRMRVAHRELPLGETYAGALGRRVLFLEDWLEHEGADDPYWGAMDHRGAVDAVDAAVLLQCGWYDLFAADMISQYERLRSRGLQPHLTMGPWTHGQFGMGAWRVLMDETVAWLRAAFEGATAPRRAPVRVFVLGADEWLELDEWPPAGCREETWYLTAQRGLTTEMPTRAGTSSYRYDPSDPTPSVGGALLFLGAGPKDNRALEQRSDVLTFTSAPLTQDLAVFGAPTVDLHVHWSAPSADLFVRLCDVEPSGRSTNICDTILRVSRDPGTSDDGAPRRVRLTLSPTACRFIRGHRLRLQVSSGAHPRFARNPGSGEPIATAARLVDSHQTIFSGPDHPSSVTVLAGP
jgi:putative CocE/NonD family hydrolase